MFIRKLFVPLKLRSHRSFYWPVNAEHEQEKRTFPKIPHRNEYSGEHCEDRRKWVEQFTGADLTNCKGWWKDERLETGILKGHIEQPIGLVQLPLAVAGPMLFNGKHAEGLQLLPMAVVEGSVIAATTRGATAITQSGGVETCAGEQNMIRAPFFTLASIDQATVFGEWIKQQVERLQETVVKKHSKHSRLKDIRTIYDLENVHIHLVYETGDACGQNASTKTAWEAVKAITAWARQELPHVDITNAILEGTSSGDKHPSFVHGTFGRGINVSAKAVITEDMLQYYLKLDSDLLMHCYESVSRVLIRLGANHNINMSNVLAAVFAATGQDLGCVPESSNGVFTIEYNREDDRGGVLLRYHNACLMVGTVGGGTTLPTQSECLDIMGCRGEGKVGKLAEIIAGFCMALDISTLSALAVGHFADAHSTLGSKK